MPQKNSERYRFREYLKQAGLSKDAIAAIPDYELPFKPMKHQIEGLKLLLNNTYYGLFDEPGTGKTMQMQALAIVNKYDGMKTAVVMPPALLDQFNYTLHATFHGVERYLKVHWLYEGPKKRQQLFAEWEQTEAPDVLLVSYSMILKPEVRELIEHHYDSIVCDEAQMLRNPESQIHNLIYELTDEEKKQLVLATGTAIHNTPEDVYAMCHLINRAAYKSFDHFKRMHQRTRKVSIRPNRFSNRRIMVNKVIGWKNLKTMNENLFRNARRVKADEVLDRKKPHIIEMRVRLSDKHMKFYRAFAKKMVFENSAGDIVDADSQQKLRQELLRCIVEPHLYEPEIKSSAVLEMVDTLIDMHSLSGDNKIILVAYHNSTVEELAERYKRYKPALVYGKVTGKRRDREVRRFKDKDSDCLMAIINAKAGGAGLDFQEVCSTMILVTPLSVPGDFQQVVGRIDRKGQTRPVKVYVIAAEGTLAVRLAKLQKEKESLAHAVDSTMDTLLAEALVLDHKQAEKEVRKLLKAKA